MVASGQGGHGCHAHGSDARGGGGDSGDGDDSCGGGGGAEVAMAVAATVALAAATAAAGHLISPPAVERCGNFRNRRSHLPTLGQSGWTIMNNANQAGR